MILTGVLRSQEPLKDTGQRHHTSTWSRNVVRSNPRKVMYVMINIHPESRTYRIKKRYQELLGIKIFCGSIGILKWHIIHVISKWTSIITMYDDIIYPVGYVKYKYLPHWKLLNIRDKYFWCCATSSITISYVNKLKTSEMFIFCVIEHKK